MILIDGDKIVYSVGFATNKKDCDPEPIENALYLVKQIMRSIFSELGNDDYRLFLTSSDKSNYRFALAKTVQGSYVGYKGNRDPTQNQNMRPKPVHYDAIRDYMEKYWKAEMISNMEADDALGIYSDPESTILAHVDKDINMIPGWHYNIDTKEKYYVEDGEPLRLSDKNKILGGGWRFFYAQMLQGDSSDNIPGVPQHGPKRIITGFKKSGWEGINKYTQEEDVVQQVFDLYKREFQEEAKARFLEVADLLWIQRVENVYKSEWLKEIIDVLQE